jgi:Zn-finger nucleic acid-binding protein
MSPVSHQDIEVDRCAKCGGLWFDLLEAEDLKKLGGSEAIDTGDTRTGKVQNKIGKIKCPKDSAMMIRMVVNGQPHIWYEGCPVCHGTYFDAGEFKDFKAETFIDTVKAIFRKERK